MEAISKKIAWGILLGLIFLRAFICEQAFLFLGAFYLSFFLLAIFAFLVLNKRRLLSTRLAKMVALFMLVAVVSSVLSVFTLWGLLELCFLAVNIGVFYCVSGLSEERIKRLVNTVVLASGIAAAYAIYHYIFGFKHLSAYLENNPGVLGNDLDFVSTVIRNRRTFSSFISPNIFASYLLMMFFYAVGLLLSMFEQLSLKNNYRRIFWILLCIALVLTALALTKSLAAVITLMVSLPVFSIFALRNYSQQGLCRKRFKLAAWICLAITVVFVALTLVFVQDRVVLILDTSAGDNSVVQRGYYWLVSLKMFLNYPLLGVGWRKFGLFYEFIKPLNANVSHYAHNVFLQVLAETGVIGFVSFLGVVLFYISASLRNIRGSRYHAGLKLGLFFAGLAFLIHNLFDIGFYFGQASLFFWISIAALNVGGNKKIPLQ
jgi:O-antigen ligase